ncbi:MAG: anthranilate phosphoribosyltransferase [Archaeoglobi archaeon]|nr:anthranilate phosphoribosyltransferase [Candidatus Mnemosynella bozhongmuii]
MLEKVVTRRNLSFEEAREAFLELFNENEIRVAAFLSAVETKGVTSEELAGFASAMRELSTRINLGDVCDTCGTGGDRAGTINVSTASAILLSCFEKVAKHGNSSVTSKSGSADVLKELGMRVELDADEAKMMIERSGFTFLFAPKYHAKLRKIMPVRKALGIKTVFNILGPLCNPASPSRQLIGVSSEELVDRVSEAVQMLGVRRAVIVHGYPLDEVNPRGKTLVSEVDGEIEKYLVSPEDFGLRESKLIPCSSSQESAARVRAALSGRGLEEDLNFILINSAMALFSAEGRDLTECAEIMKECIESGRAIRKLEEIVCASRNLS